MVIIYYNPKNEKIFVCTEDEPMKELDVNDPDLLNLIPNDDILYVQSGHLITKKQFASWLSGSMKLEDITIQDTQNMKTFNTNKKYIHPTGNGGICIEDIKTPKYPDGVIMRNKWDFVPLEEIGGEEAIDSSVWLRTAIARGKIEIVSEDYVRAHQHKNKKVKQQSLRDMQLDKIIIKDSRSGTAIRVAESGGIPYDDDEAIPVYIN